MARTLRVLVQVMGWACVAIGLFHVALGNAAIPGVGSAGATVDSWGRFMGASFVGYGLAWLWAARQRPIPATAVRALSAVFLLGGLGRLISLAVHGWPQWFQIALTVIELGLPPALFWLAPSEEREHDMEEVAGPVDELAGSGGVRQVRRKAAPKPTAAPPGFNG
ncbi:protein of unknown function [Streptomyces sp. OV198]|uniref:DUF4345 domain-containing protein n=1 Tax=Streptomyces TaxID=1883 RepID=UPI000BB10763|nr:MULTISPECIES: DUF4345 domain-containing protein [Streptomyces]PBC93092.1 uncharacterized protein DUF4345 [Streptomyces sp. Ag82_O1-15]SOF02975.1 protein of unknown function [Streptomyces sp. OV198]